MRKRIKLLLGLSILAMLSVVACGSGSEEKKAEKKNTEVEVETEAPEVNLLTGLPTLTEEAIGKRPVAIMINNIPKSLPQYGIAEADVIFEISVEGGSSRLMAIYGDYTQVPVVCSIRSCRKYFPELSEGFDAIYVSSGMNDDVRNHVNALGVTMFEGAYNTGGLFGRDQSRVNSGYKVEHTMYFDGTGLVEAVEKLGTRIDLEEGKTSTAFNFCGTDETVAPTGDACSSVTVDFGAVDATLVYDEASNTYLKEINGKAQMDSVANTQLAFTNVILLETEVGYDANGANMTINWTGGDSSVGYYISNGTMQKIHYSKDSVESRLVFYDEDGNELEINRGKTYIAFYPTGEIEFE